MRGLLAILFAFAFSVCVRMSKRAMRRSESWGDWAGWCDAKTRTYSEPRP
jgi:hypothetical protein